MTRRNSRESERDEGGGVKSESKKGRVTRDGINKRPLNKGQNQPRLVAIKHAEEASVEDNIQHGSHGLVHKLTRVTRHFFDINALLLFNHTSLLFRHARLFSA